MDQPLAEGTFLFEIKLNQSINQSINQPVLYDAMSRKGRDIHTCELCHLASEKHRICPKMVSEAISKFKNISGGACPRHP